MQLSAPLVGPDEQMLGLLIAREHLLGQPQRQILAVACRGLAKTEEIAYLGAVVLDGAALPVVAQVLVGLDPHLPCDVGDYPGGELLPGLREAPLVLEELEEDGEAQARVPRLVSEERQLVRIQGPVLGELVGRPESLHTTAPVVMGAAGATWRKVPRSVGVGTFQSP